MTIAGKGGRPRKWRSDADRARAYRARQRGEPEPRQLDQIVDESDELANARREIQLLNQRVGTLRRDERNLRSELDQAWGDLEAERARVDRLLQANESLRSQVAEATAERERLYEALKQLATMPDTALPPPAPANRAERRRAARDLRRRH